jgi:Leucine-rich repeat (LRR) protein
MPRKKPVRFLPDIPDDMWREIAQFAVSSLHTLFELSTISKRLSRVFAHPIMLSHVTVRLREPSQLVQLGTLGSRLRSLRFDHASDDSFESILLPPTVTDLNLTSCNITSQGLALAIRGLTELTHLNLNDCNVEDFVTLANLPLVKLAVGGSGNSYSDFCDAEELLPTLPKLQELDVHSLCLCTDPFFDRPGSESTCVRAISRLPNLHTLNLESTDLHDREFMKLAPLARTLRHLNVAHTEITDRSASVMSGFWRLESLSVNACHVSNRCMRAISKLLQLRVLCVSDCQRMITNKSLALLSPLKFLEQLDISCNPVQRFEPLYGLHNLRVLDVSACKQVCMDKHSQLVFQRESIQRERDITDEARRGLAYHMPLLVVKSPTNFI